MKQLTAGQPPQNIARLRKFSVKHRTYRRTASSFIHGGYSAGCEFIKRGAKVKRSYSCKYFNTISALQLREILKLYISAIFRILQESPNAGF